MDKLALENFKQATEELNTDNNAPCEKSKEGQAENSM